MKIARTRKKKWNRKIRNAVTKYAHKIKIQERQGEVLELSAHGYTQLYGNNLYTCDAVTGANPAQLDYLREDDSASIKYTAVSGEIRNYHPFPVMVEIFKVSIPKEFLATGAQPGDAQFEPTFVHGFFDPKKMKVKKVKTFMLGQWHNAGDGTTPNTRMSTGKPFFRRLYLSYSFGPTGKYVTGLSNTTFNDQWREFPFFMFRATRLDNSGAGLTADANLIFYYKNCTKFIDAEARTSNAPFTIV